MFTFSQVLTVVPFSYLSDSVGRKPIVILGNFGVAVSTACFGLSKTFQGMLVSRALGGALGGSWAAMRVMLAEMVPKHFHGELFEQLMVLVLSTVPLLTGLPRQRPRLVELECATVWVKFSVSSSCV